jgi:hypothetical protein
VAVELEGRTDYVISALDQKRRKYGPVTLAGSFGFVSTDLRGKVIRSFLLDGTELSCGGTKTRLPEGRMTFAVDSVNGRTFILKEPLPRDRKFEGRCLLAAGTGYEVESATGKTITVRDYPAIECSEVCVLFSAGAKPI